MTLGFELGDLTSFEQKEISADDMSSLKRGFLILDLPRYACALHSSANALSPRDLE